MPRLLRELLIAFVLVVLTSTLAYAVLTSSVYKADWTVVARYSKPLLAGWGVTLGISLASLVVATVIAVLLVAGQRLDSAVSKGACQTYIELIRGTPLLVQLLIGYYVFAPAFNLNSPLIAGVFVLSCFAAAYLAEIIRGGIESIAESQREAARAVGFTTAQTYRFVIIPQTVRRILPAVAGQFANLIKDSSLLSVIAVADFTKQARDASANSYTVLELYIPLAIGYLLLTIPIALAARQLERRFAYAT